MSRLLLALVLVAALVLPAVGQYPVRIPPETVEPPLADASTPIQQTAVREPRALPAAVRTLDAPAPVVQLRVMAPTVAAAGREMDLKLVAENASRVPAQDVVIAYALPPGAGLVKAQPEAEQRGTDLVWPKIGTLIPAGRHEISVTIRLPAEATDIEHKARVSVAHDQTVRT